MSSNDEGFIIIRDPNNRPVKAKVLKYRKVKGEDYEYQLEDGTKIKLIIEVNHISKPVDPKTGDFIVNTTTGEPVIHVDWGIRLMTIYSESALRGFKGDNINA